MSLDAVRDEIAGVEGVATVHDLHLWAITQSQPMLTAHVVLAGGADEEESVRRAIERACLRTLRSAPHHAADGARRPQRPRSGALSG